MRVGGAALATLAALALQPLAAALDAASYTSRNNFDESSIIARGDVATQIGVRMVDDDYYNYQRDFSVTTLHFSTATIRQPVKLELAFTSNLWLNASDVVALRLPRFTSGLADGTPGPSKALMHSWTTLFELIWREGKFDHSSMPFANSTLHIRLLPGRKLQPGRKYTIEIYQENGLRAQCGFEENSKDITLSSNASGYHETKRPVKKSSKMGSGCEAQLGCAGNGNCDYCKQRCECVEGWGGALNGGTVPPPLDVAPDCSTRTCPTGPAIRTVPYGSNVGHHHDLECSGNGICDRQSGLCTCPVGWSGEACQRQDCPNDCSGHGRCLTMEELSGTAEALPLSNDSLVVSPYWTQTLGDEYGVYGSQDGQTNLVKVYGNLAGRENVAWDFNVMRGCVCESSWDVGLGPGQRQQPEWFGADCSLKRCPSGDDPRTTRDETDCHNVTAEGHRGRGARGNLCHVDCSGRGTCDHEVGKCECFVGFEGENCGTGTVYSGLIRG